MKKRLVTLLLCLGMVSTLFVGCGSSDGEKQTESGGSTEGTKSGGTESDTLIIPVSATAFFLIFHSSQTSRPYVRSSPP